MSDVKQALGVLSYLHSASKMKNKSNSNSPNNFLPHVKFVTRLCYFETSN